MSHDLKTLGTIWVTDTEKLEVKKKLRTTSVQASIPLFQG